MNQLKKRAEKVTRLLSMENRKVNAITVKIAGVNAALTQLDRMKLDTLGKLQGSISSDQNLSADLLSQRFHWDVQLRHVLVALDQKIGERLEEREQLLDEIRHQKKAIRGWECVLDEIQEELELIENNRLAAEADDAYLSRVALQPINENN